MSGNLVLLIILAAVATWRITHMLLREAGPLDVFRRIRQALGVIHYEDGKVAYAKYEITTCLWCLSMWVGGFFGLLIYFVPEYALWITLPCVFSAVAVVIDRHYGMEQ